MRGLLNCGQTFIVFGYGRSQYASHGRPVWNSGKMPAHATANSVIASANRLIDVRHVCLSKSRIAEISVPAWPVPMTGGLPVATTAARGSSMGSAISALQLRIHVPHCREIGRPRTRVQLAEQRVIPLVGLQLRDAARRIVQVAEDDGVGGTGLL